jgi:YD repeat-containing protein
MCTCVSTTPAEAVQSGDFAIVGRSKISIGSGCSILPGSGEAGVWSGGPLDLGKHTRCGGIQALGDISVGEGDVIHGGVTADGQVKIGSHVVVDGSVISGRDAVIGRNTRVSGDVIARGTVILQQRATVSGSVLEAGDPEGAVSITLPEIPPVSSDGPNLSTDKKSAHTIPPGVYRDYTFGERNEVIFASGTYTFRDLVLGPRTRIVFSLSDGPVTVFIAEKMIFGKGVMADIIEGNPQGITYVLASGAEVVAKDGSVVLGTFLGPDADIKLEKGVFLKGAITANRISVGPKARIESNRASLSPPEVSFLVNPETIIMGQATTLTWDATNATSISIDNGIGDVDVNGSLMVAPTMTTTYTLTATGPGGKTTRSVCVTVKVPLPQVAISAHPSAVPPGQSSTVTWTSRYADRVEIDQGIGEVQLDGSVVVYPLQTTTYNIAAAGSGGTAVDAVTITVDNPIPPDPRETAPELDMTGVTPFAEAVEFLYTGRNPVQTAIEPDAIESGRAGVVRGRVVATNAEPLPGVTISVLNHKEFGETRSRMDGLFDLAVNGGGPLTLVYSIDGYLPVQRRVVVPWGDYVWVDDVTLIPWDEEVTAVNLSDSSIPIQVARGGIVEDADGIRQATVFFPRGTEAEAVMPDGTTEPLATLHVRATEYTVGETGPSAMPGDLPRASAYTYCVELSVDEAVSAGAAAVRFSRSIPFYVENFLGFSVGSAVPAGYYDRSRGVWVPSDNGRVIRILGVSETVAEVDIDGDGYADDDAALAELGMTGAELEQLAGLYKEGQSLWRVSISHLTPWDCNWPWGLPPGATAPEVSEADNMPLDNPDIQCGSVIEAQNQTLGESIAIAGAPFRIHYRSDRVPGRKDGYTLRIPLSGASIPESLLRIRVRIEIAGQLFTDTLEPAANLTYAFTWDGLDAYGRTRQGRHPATVSIGYVYRPVYYSVRSELQRSFGQFPEDTTFSIEWRMPQCIGTGICSSVLDGVAVWKKYQVMLGGWDAREQGLGGWTITMHHAYDPTGKVLMLGDGRRRAAVETGNIITTIAGTGSSGYSGDGLPARQARIGLLYDIAVGADGSIFIPDFENSCVRRIGPDGIITRVAGTGTFGYSEDGGPATEAQLGRPYGVAVGPDGSLYISDRGNSRIRKVDHLGTITTVAGNGISGYSGDGGPATEAQLNRPQGIAVDSEGALYIADTQNHRIRKVGTDGIITTVAGRGCKNTSGDGRPAQKACIDYPVDVAVGNQAFFIAEGGGYVVRRVGSDGIITTFAGYGSQSGDGGPAIQAYLSPWGLALDAAGNLYIADGFAHRVRIVDGNGIITTVAGREPDPDTNGGADGGLATQATLRAPCGLAIGPDGSLYIAETEGQRIRRVASGFPDIPGSGLANFSIPSQDGRQVYIFDSTGRHLYTLDSVTGAVIYEFAYDDRNLLESIIDGNGNTVTIERDPNGRPFAIVAPNGSRTDLTVDANGWLSSVTNPEGDVIRMSYGQGGLLASKTDPRGFIQRYAHDTLGRLIRDEDPSGGYKALSRTEENHALEVNISTAMDRLTRYRAERYPTGDRLRTVIRPGGTVEETLSDRLGNKTVKSPDGTVMTVRQGPDPRFGMLAPVPESITLTTPGGVSATAELQRIVTLEDSEDLLSISASIDELDVNGRTYYSALDAATRTTTYTTPEGRPRTVWWNGLGQVTADRFVNLYPVGFTYDSRGRVSGVSQGTATDARAINLTYDLEGFLQSVTDSLA